MVGARNRGLLEKLWEEYAAGRLTKEQCECMLRTLGEDPEAFLTRHTLQEPPRDELREKRDAAPSITIIGDGNVIGNGSLGQVVKGGMTPVPCIAADSATALTCYLSHVIATNRRLQLQGIRSAGQLATIDLEEVYVTLATTVRRTVAAEELLVSELTHLAPGELTRRACESFKEVVEQVKVQVQEVLAMHSHLVVLGDPGSGKTTLLRYLALTYARDLAGEGGLVEQRLQLREQRVPILLPLRDFARYLEAEHPNAGTDGPKLLLDYLHTYFANQDIVLPERFFSERFKEGSCLVLLDGVDEVAKLVTRQRVAKIIERFTVAYPDNRIVVTSRLVGYTDTARLGGDYAVATVRDFTQEDITRFVTYWNRAVEVALAGEESPYALQQAERQTAALLGAIQRNARVRELAVNPLLLTVIALVQRYRAQLPERRAELYEEAIEVLLGKWDEAKGLEEGAVFQGMSLDAGDRRTILEPIALWMMEQHAREIEVDVLREQLGQRFKVMLGDAHQAEKAADGFLRLINERSGLLVERGLGVYAFSHLTFQEYLAARTVADRADYIAYTLERVADSWWREVILLEVGFLSMQGTQRTAALVHALMECTDEEALYPRLVLAAEALRDLGLARAEGELLDELHRRLRKEFETPLHRDGRQSREEFCAIIRRRAAAAEALGRVESGRPGTQPAFWTLPYGEPVWVKVPAGEFWMGSESGDEDEKPVHCVYLKQFWIAKTPVTNAQYHLFVEATDYKPPRHWEEEQIPGGLENHPVVNVSWYDALAYCRWLAEVTGKAVLLPSEAQWEKASRGYQDQRAYPWGDVWWAIRCNTAELDLGTTTPVGIFPEGASPYGCLDMVGNVWEWTLSLWGRRWERPDFQYPYDPTDGREALGAGMDTLRVVRGGSYNLSRVNARCTSRDRGLPNFSIILYGFRVAIAT